MHKIYKYPLQVEGAQKIMMPSDAEILCVQVQNNQPCIWALVEPTNSLTPYRFYIYGTGQPIKDERSYDAYIGTFQLDNGALVFHVFKEVDASPLPDYEEERQLPF